MASCGFRYVGRVKADPISTGLKRWGIDGKVLGIYISRKKKYGGNWLIHQKVQ